MMGDLILRAASEPALTRTNYRPRSLTWRERRDQYPGLGAEARIYGAFRATRAALRQAELLSGDEQRAIRNAPLGERRYEQIVDDFVEVASGEIRRLVRRW